MLEVQFRNTVNDATDDFPGTIISVEAIGMEIEQMHSIGGVGNRIRLTYTYQIQCSADFYGPTCSTFCA